MSEEHIEKHSEKIEEKKILTEEEIDSLKEIHLKKKKIRQIFLVVGFILIGIGLTSLLLSWDLGPYSFIIDILIMVFGMIIASKYFIAPYYLRENSLMYLKDESQLRETPDKKIKFQSFPLTRLIAAGYFMAVVAITYAAFGIGVGHDNTRHGTAFVLGGPSFFYFTGLFALVFSLSLLLYVIIATFKGSFYESENFYFFYEFRHTCPWLTEVPKKDIEAIRYQNNHLGPKLAWVMLLIPFIVLQLITGISLFFNNDRQAPEYVFSMTMTIISIFDIFALIVLVCFAQNYYEIATEDMLYEMWFAPIRLRDQPGLTDEIADFFNCGIDSRNMNDDNNIFKDVSNTHFQLYSILFGLFLIISAIVMLTQMVLFGPFFWWVALMYGIMLLLKAMCYDFSRKDADKFLYNKESKTFKFQRKFGFKFHFVTANKVESVEVRKWYRQLDFFDIFGLGGMLVMLTMQQIQGWAIADTIGTQTDNIISTIYAVIVIALIIFYLVVPIDVIEFKTPTITHRIPVTLKNDKKLISKLLSFPSEVTKRDMKKTFLQRIIIVLLIIGIISAYTMYTMYTMFS